MGTRQTNEKTRDTYENEVGISTTNTVSYCLMWAWVFPMSSSIISGNSKGVIDALVGVC